MLIDDSKEWKQTKEFKNIESKWTKLVSNYKKNVDELEMGSVLISTVSVAMEGKTFVALMKVIKNNKIVETDLKEAISMVCSF